MRNSSPNRDVEIAVVVKRSTERAILVNHGVREEVWVPKSQINDFVGDDIDTAESIWIPEWLATEKGMV
jgi:hypothetical protein